jgi:hypothetical protein
MMRQEIVSTMATREDLVAVRTDIAALRKDYALMRKDIEVMPTVMTVRLDCRLPGTDRAHT